jgi:CRP-like cAMP-binding protein
LAILLIRVILSKIFYVLLIDGGEVIFRKGERSAGAYLVISGKMEMVDYNGAGEDVHVEVVAPGGIPGEMGTFNSKPCEYTARAKTPVNLFKLDRDELESLAAHTPRTAAQLFVNVVKITAKG